MSNTFLSANRIARAALPVLENNLVMAGLVYRDLDNTFANEGDTIQVRKPASFTAVEFDGDLTGEYQAISESSVSVQLGTIADVSVEVTSKELSLDIMSFSEQIIKPAMVSLAEKIDADLCGLYKDVYSYYGTSGTTPDELADISGARKLLNTQKVPTSDRSFVIDPEADAKFTTLDIFARVDALGSTEGLREASLGRKLGMNMFMDQNIKTHTAGTFTALAAPKLSAATAVGDTTIAVDGGSGTETLLDGDIFTLGSYQYAVTANATATAGAIAAVSVYPAIKEINADNADLTFPDKTALAHTANLAFHKNAFALVSRPLMSPMGGAESYTTSIGNGINVRVTMGYDMDTKTNKVSFDVLYGVKTLYPELATRLIG